MDDIVGNLIYRVPISNFVQLHKPQQRVRCLGTSSSYSPILKFLPNLFSETPFNIEGSDKGALINTTVSFTLYRFSPFYVVS